MQFQLFEPIVDLGFRDYEMDVSEPETLIYKEKSSLTLPSLPGEQLNRELSVSEPKSLIQRGKSEGLCAEPSSGLYKPRSLTHLSINKYYPGKKATAYYRFSYRDGKRTKHKHIPGGNIYNPLAMTRAARLKEALAAGATIKEVLNLITSFTDSK